MNVLYLEKCVQLAGVSADRVGGLLVIAVLADNDGKLVDGLGVGALGKQVPEMIVGRLGSIAREHENGDAICAHVFAFSLVVASPRLVHRTVVVNDVVVVVGLFLLGIFVLEKLVVNGLVVLTNGHGQVLHALYGAVEFALELEYLASNEHNLVLIGELLLVVLELGVRSVVARVAAAAADDHVVEEVAEEQVEEAYGDQAVEDVVEAKEARVEQRH